VAPLQQNASRSLGKGKPPLEGGEEQRIQAMDASQETLHDGKRESVNLQETLRDGQQESVKLQKLRDHWFVKYADILNGVPSELPPLREINHWIPLIDDGKRYYYHLPCCPDAIKPQLMEKMKQYVGAGWWIPKVVLQAAPLLCIPKKSGKLRTVVDC